MKRFIIGFGWLVAACVAVAGTGTSNEFRLDTRSGDRVSAGLEELTFSNLWDGDANATVTIRQDGAAIFEGLSGEGVKTWAVERNGRYELTHTTYTNGVKGKVETAVFVVEGKDVPVGELTIDWGQKSFVYDGQPKEPVITVKDRGTTLTKDTHYLVEYKDNVNVGTAKAIVKGIKPYVGEVTNEFLITAAPIGPGGGEEPGSGEIPEGGLSKFDATYVYDGEGHTINTQALYAVTLVGSTPSFSFSLDGETGWQNDPFVYTNVGEYVIWYKITAPNYEDYKHQAKVTIQPLDDATWYVDSTNGDDTNSGLSWEKSFRTIQHAVDLVGSNNTIVVTNGVYEPFQFTKNMALEVRSVNGAAVTVIDGKGVARCVANTDAISSGESAGLYRKMTVRGFSIVNGNPNPSGVAPENGGGVFACKIFNCIVSNCCANYGGGIYETEAFNSIICNNTCNNGKGGGMYGGYAEGCLISENIGGTPYGSGVGGVYGGTAVNCNIVNNVGWGICLEYNWGDGIYNSIIYGNTSGGKIRYANSKLVNCCYQDISYSDGALPVNRIEGDPKLDAQGRLLDSSPCINAGENSFVTINQDLDGKDRIVNGVVDVGCYEFVPSPVLVEVTDFDGVYDGKGHGISVTVTKPASGATVEYATSAEGPWYSNPLLFTNVCEATEWYRVMAKNYIAITNSAKVTIQPLVLTVTFDANGGSCPMASKMVTHGATYGTLPTPTWTGHIFAGWYTAASGGDEVKDSTAVNIMAPQTLYAHWVSVSGVSAKQRYPWNGLVDIVVAFAGESNDVAKVDCSFIATNSATKAELSVASVTRKGADAGKDNAWSRQFVWDAGADVGAVKIDDVVFTVAAEIPWEGGVRLWENGPYWAECNVGATKPEEYGYYFWWGDTVGYTEGYHSGVETSIYVGIIHVGVTWVSSKGEWMSNSPIGAYSVPTYDKSSSQLKAEGWIDEDCNLLAAHDAATAHLGTSWRMPTKADVTNLVNKCVGSWTTLNGVNGCLVTGRGSYSSKCIFIPAAGYGDGSRITSLGSRGFCWSSTTRSTDTQFSDRLGFSSDGFWQSNDYRGFGQPVRPIRGFSKSSVVTTHLSLDCREGDRVSAGTAELTFSNLWDGDAEATVTISQDGAAIFAGLKSEGVKTWSVDRNGRYVLTHTTYTNGVKGKVETAVFVVEGKEVPVSELTIDWGRKSFVYDGQPKEPVITVKDGATTLTKDTHYLVEYKDNVNVGTAKAIVKGIKPYVGEVTNEFLITAAPIGPGGGEEPGSGEIPEGGLSKFDATYVYDGEGHTINTQALYVVTLVGSTPSFSFSLDGETGWQNDPFVYTNVGEYVMWYKITAPNYEDYKHQAKVTIKPLVLTVTFDANGGTCPMASKTVTHGAAYGTLLTPNWTGHIFTGWYTAASGGNEVKDSTTVSIMAPQTLYAHWVSVKSVSAKQRYPWNGLVDIVVAFEGESNDVAKVDCSFIATNSATKAALSVASITRKGANSGKNNAWSRRFVWNAGVDVGVVKVDDVALTVFVRIPEEGGVQLWENGPYWAECNVGATEPEEYGYYFWWGDTVGYMPEGGVWNDKTDDWYYSGVTWVSSSGERMTSSPFNDAKCPTYNKNNAELRAQGYIDSAGNLVAAHDAAAVHRGASWRVPTAVDFERLIANCDTTWMEKNGVYGLFVRGRSSYSSQTIFLPAAGYGIESTLRGCILHGYYWSSTPDSDDRDLKYVWGFYFDLHKREEDLFYNLSAGKPVRPLREFASASAAEKAMTHLSLDCREGGRVSAGIEELSFSNLWDGDAEAAVTIAQDGVAILTGLKGEGVKTWTVDRNGRYVLTHTTYNNGVAGKVETAVFVVEGKEVLVSELTIDWGQSSFVYDGQPKEPVITVKDRGTTLAKDTHYLVEYKDNVNVGTAKVIVKGINPYVGEVTNTFTITKAAFPGGGEEPGDGTVPAGGVSKFDAVVMYDGEGHTIRTNELVAAFKAAVGGDVAVSYARGGAEGPALPWMAVAPDFTNVCETSVWYKVTSANYLDFVHEARVTVTNRPVTVTSGTKTDFTYDGKLHAYTNLTVTAGSFVAGEGIATSNWATVTTVAEGEVPNAFDFEAEEGTKLSNYALTVVTGRIAVVSPDAVVVTVTGHVASVVYDGLKKSVSGYDIVSISDPLYTVADFKFTGQSATNGTNAGTYPMGLKSSDFANTNSNFATVVFNVTDGKLVIAQAANAWTTEPALEGWTYGETAKTPVGAAKFGEVTFAYSPMPVGAAGDYTMTATVAGTANYTGLSKTVGFTIAKATLPGGGEEPGDGTVPEGGLSKFDTVAMYDGEGHTIRTNELVAAFKAAVGGDVAVSYARGGAEGPALPWMAVAPDFTNVCETSVWYKVTSANCLDFVHEARVTVTNRPVTLTSGTKLDFVYDGKPHAYTNLTVTAGSFVAGEGIATSNWATVTTVAEGKVPNAFDYAAQEGTLLSNYALTVVTGEIAIVSPDAVVVTITGHVASVVYDGLKKSVSGYDVVSISDPLYTAADFKYTGQSATNGTNAGTYPMGLKSSDFANTNPNFATVVFNVTDGGLVISQAANAWTTEPAIDGWTYGETAKTPVGAAKFGAASFAYDPIPVGAAGDYTMTATVAGTANYTGLSKTVGFTIAKGKLPGGGEEPGGGTVPEGGLSKFDTVAMYDGEGHAIATNELVAAFKSVIGNDFAVSYAVGESGGQGLPALPWMAVAPDFTNVCVTSVWYKVTSANYQDYVHEAKVAITNRPVTIASGTKTDFTYNGKPHAYTNLTVTAGSFVAGEGIATSNWATVTTVAEGKVPNAFDFEAEEGTLLSNYALTVVTGEIAVVSPDAVVVAITGHVASVVYDGLKKSVSGYDIVSISDPLYTAADFKFTGQSATNGTNAGTYPMGLKSSDFANTNPNFATVVFNVTDGGLVISQAANAWTTEPAIEGWTYGETAKTPVGAAKFGAASFAYDPMPVGAAGNYTMTASVAGTANYTGLSKTVDFTIAKATLPGGGEEPGGGTVPAGGVSKFDTVAMYDGEGHLIATNDLVAAFKSVIGNDFAVSYAVGESGGQGLPALPWMAVAPDFTNVCVTSVWYKVTSANYQDYVHEAKVTVTNRPVTLTSGTETFDYDGNAHSNMTVTVSGEGFVAGEGVTSNNFATITEKGSKPNAFDYELILNPGSVAENYRVTCVTGTLTVVSVANAWLVEPTVTGKAYDGMPAAVTMGTPKFGTVSVTYDGGQAAAPVVAGNHTAKFAVAATADYGALEKVVNYTIGKVVVDEPLIASKTYNEQAQVADIAGSVCYTVVRNNGGTMAGRYAVVLQLVDAVNYRWASSEDAKIILTFEVTSDENVWTSGPAAPTSVIGGGATFPVATAKYGDVEVRYSGTAVDGTVVENALQIVRPGTYTATFKARTTSSWSELTASVPLTVSAAGDVAAGALKALSATPVSVSGVKSMSIPRTWFSKYQGFTAKFGNDPSKAALMKTGKLDGSGKEMQVWQDYVAGTDPTKEDSRLSVKIEFEDGKPKISWTPNQNTNGKRIGERVYTVWGKKSLDDKDWTPNVDETTGEWNFFKVTVDMPEEE